MVERVRPQELQEVFMEIAWRDFILWAYRFPEIRSAFTAATGKSLYTPPRTPLDAMIDQATKYDSDSAQTLDEFVRWVTKEYWGEECAPEAYKAAVAALSVSSK